MCFENCDCEAWKRPTVKCYDHDQKQTTWIVFNFFYDLWRDAWLGPEEQRKNTMDFNWVTPNWLPCPMIIIMNLWCVCFLTTETTFFHSSGGKGSRPKMNYMVRRKMDGWMPNNGFGDAIPNRPGCVTASTGKRNGGSHIFQVFQCSDDYQGYELVIVDV